VLADLKANSMSTTQSLKYTQSKALQKPSHFEGGSEDVLSLKLGAGSFEQTGLTLSTKLTSEAKVEVNSVV
jgi:hypothetical protein